MKRAIFPGSFNPIHEGHINIIRRAAKLFDEVYVAVSINVDKENGDSLEERFIQVKNKVESLKLNNVMTIINNDLTMNCAKKYGCGFIVRSLRNEKDFSYELNIAQTHHKLDSEVETVLFFADEELANKCSTDIRKIQEELDKIKENKKRK